MSGAEPTPQDYIDRTRALWDSLEKSVTESVLRQVRLELGYQLQESDAGRIEDASLSAHDAEVVLPTVTALIDERHIRIVRFLDAFRDLVEAFGTEHAASPVVGDGPPEPSGGGAV